MRIIVLASYAPSLVNFRGPLLQTLVALGCEVIACAPESDERIEKAIRQLGAKYEQLTLCRTGMNPFKDLIGFAHLNRLIWKYRPDIVLSYTIKPVIYGSLAAWLVGVPKICSIITGLGYSFTNKSLFNRLVCQLYKLALSTNEVVFFQNSDDEREFRRRGIFPYDGIAPSEKPLCEMQQYQRTVEFRKPNKMPGPPTRKTVVVSGSGVDLDFFSATALRDTYGGEQMRMSPSVVVENGQHPELASKRSSKVVFLLIARLLRDKGILEFAEAARRLKAMYPECRFQVLGPYDPNPAALRLEEIKVWSGEGAIEYLGVANDVRPFLRACDVYVLPSYREGTPRTVLEAMATGRAVITTDAPGCRETIKVRPAEEGAVSKAKIPATLIEGYNGFLVPIRDANSLTYAMEQFILKPELCTQMGRAGRDYAQERYDVHEVNKLILKELEIVSDR